MSDRSVAIIGVGLRVPGARDLDELWQILRAERCTVTAVPPERWDRQQYLARGRREQGRTRCVWGGFLEDADCFDAAFFKISPREAELMDPQQRLALELSWKAIEDAGIRPSSLAGTGTGVFMGLCNTDYARLLESQTDEADAYFSTGIGASLASNRVSYFLDLKGPSATIDAACASSLVAVHHAVSALRRGECEMALAGGVNLCWTPRLFIAYSQAGMLSPSGACRSFDDSADGYVRAEGGGVLLLKPLHQALRDGDPIYAAIRGSGVNHGGRTNSLTVTNPKAQAELIARVVRESGLAPERISYVETHGPGTPLGDPIEVMGLKTAFSALAFPQHARCGLGSVKSNLGHLESAAGVAGIAKVLVAMAHRTLPGTAGFQRLSKMVRLEGSPFHIVERTRDWSSEGPRVAGVSSFGFGGVNAHLLLEEVVTSPAAAPADDRPRLFPLSARSEERLRAVGRELLGYLRARPGTDLESLAHTLQMGRDAMEVRAVLRACHQSELIEALHDWLQSRPAPALDDPLAQAWLSGQTVDWPVSATAARLRLPTYPFLRERHWLTPRVSGAPSRSGARPETLVPSWQMCAPPEPGIAENTAKRVVVVGTRLAQGELLDLEDEASVEEIEELLSGELIGTIVWQASGAGGEAHARRLLRTLKALYRLGYAGRMLHWQVVTVGALEELAEPGLAAFHGILRAMAAEHPRWRLRLVDVAAGIPMPWSEILAPAGEGEPVWSYGDQGWLRQRLEPIETEPLPPPYQYRPGEVYLVIGGAGGVGSAWSREVARSGARLVWLGRRSPEQALREHEWRPDLYLQVDASQPEELRQGFKEAARLGRLAGVVLSSKVMRTERLESLSEESLLQGLLEEDRICHSLATVLAGTRLDFVLIFSSISSMAVEPRQSLYSAACLHREAFARRLAFASESPVKVISWGYWGSVGAVAGSAGFASWMERSAVASIEPEDAMPVLDRLLAGPWSHLVFIKTFRPEGRRGLPVDDGVRLRALADDDLTMPLDFVPPAAPATTSTAQLETYAERWLAAQLSTVEEIDANYRRWMESYRPLLAAGPPEEERRAWRARRDRWLADPALAGWVPLLEATLERLPDILQGRVKSVDVLFPGGASHLVEPVYSGTPETDYFHGVVAAIANALVSAAGRPIRILELGAGTGSTTRHVLAALAPGAIAEYLFSDVSNTLLRQARTRFGGAPMEYRLLNLERHPAEQEIEVGAYDLVLATNCVHATRDLRASVRHAKALLRRGGALVLNEIVRTGLLNHLTFGLLPGWWRHRDQRDDGPIVGESTWTSLLESEGLKLEGVIGPETLSQRVFLARSDGAVRLPHQAERSPLAEVPAGEATAASATAPAEDDHPRSILVEELCSCLKLSPETLKPEEPFANYGLDSIAGIDLVDRLSRRLGMELETTIIFDHPNLTALQAALTRMARPETSSPRPESVPGEDIAVIGMAGQFPGASDVAALGRLLGDGFQAVQELPPEIFRPERYQQELAQGGRPCRWGGRLPERDEFDPLFFSISPRDASQMSPHQTLVLQEGWRCLEDAGYDPRSLAGQPVGVFIGVEPSRFDGSFTGTSDAIVSSRLSYHLDLRGPALSINTGCSSSGVSLHMACESLRRGEVRMALAGGVFADLNEEDLIRLSEIGMLSPSGRCRAFEEGCDGTVLSEAVAILCLKRLADAVNDGDAIHGVIRASGINQDGSSNGITAPNGSAQEQLLRQVYARFSIDPAEISYVEAHGTGTPLGDPIEAHALKRVFAETSGRPTPCALGSVKSMLGHTAAAAGACGLIAVLLAMRSGRLPGMLGDRQPNRHLRLENSGLRLLREPQDWTASPRVAAISSFGHSGTNAHLVVSESRQLPRAAILQHPDSALVIPLSARDQERLVEVVARLTTYLREHPEAELTALCHTLQTGRHHHCGARVAFLARDHQELERQLGEFSCSRIGGVAAARADIDKSLATGDSEALAGAWVAGETVPWERLYRVRPTRVHLPTTPFARQRPGHVVRSGDGGPGEACLALVPRWQRIRPSSPPAADGPTLVLGDPTVMWTGLWGRDTRVVETTAAPQVLAEALASRPRWNRVVLQAPSRDALLVGFRLLKALLHGGHGGRPLELMVLAQAGQPEHAALLGLAGSAGKEHPAWSLRLIELESQRGLCLERLLEAPAGSSRLEACGRWRRRLLVPWRFDSRRADSPPYRQGGVYLVAGGAGGLAGAWSEHLATQYGARLIWLGRRPEDHPEVQERLRAFPVQTPLYLQADLNDLASLEKARARIQQLYPRLHGLVHSALLLDDSSLARMDEGRFFAAVACKAEGTRNLLEVMGDDELDFVLLFSALNSFAQSAGQSNYVAGCCYQDALAESYQRRWPGKVKVVNWGYWGSLGVVASPRYRSAMQARGVGSIEPSEAMPFLEQLISSPLSQAAFLKTSGPLSWPELEIDLSRRVESVAGDSVLLDGPLDPPAEKGGPTLADPAMLEMESVAATILHDLLPRLGAAPALPAAWLEGCRAWAASAGESFPEGGGESGWRRWQAGKAGWPQASTQLLEAALRGLPEVASGRTRATDVLFPEGSTQLVGQVYREDRVGAYARERLAALVSECARHGPLDILELGAGTGATTESILSALPDPWEGRYLFTDLSPAFLGPARARFGDRLEYRAIDIEKPLPDELGSFDLVIAANVLHATADLESTLKHAKAALRPGGMLLLQEVGASSLFFHLTFGLLEGWWKARDPELRCGGGPLVSPEGWRKLLAENGFVSVSFPATAAHPYGQLVVVGQSDGLTEKVLPSLASSPIKEAPVCGPAPPGRAMAGVRSGEGRVRETVLAQLCHALLLDAEQIDPEVSFMDYGLDSISGVSLIANLNRELGLELSNVDLFDYPTLSTMVDHIVERYPPKIETAPSAQGHQGAGAVAIIGMSGRFKQSEDYHQLWSRLRLGQDLVGPVERFPNLDAQAALLDDIRGFDARFFNISGAEAACMDPQQRIFLEESWRALEDAGYAGPASDGKSCGVYLGCHEGDYARLLGEQPPAQAFWGNSSAVAAARIAYVLNLKGPAIAIDTACSSSLVAIHLACQSLCSGEVEMALAGGVFLHSTDKYFRSAQRAGMLSARGRCASFDEEADGFVFGEGAGALVLKLLDRAVADGDAIHAVIRGWGVNQDGTTNGITAPSARSQEELIADVYERFGVDPERIGCVEAHGTATRLGDPIELQALTRAFRRFTSRRGYCALGSLKSNLGHASAAAGVAGVLKLVMGMKAGEVAPSLHFRHNPDIDFESTPFRVNAQLRPWPAEQPLAAISGFGFSGTNAHLVLDHPPRPSEQSQHSPSLILLSARNAPALRELAARFESFCGQGTTDCAAMAYTLRAGRKHHKERLACLVGSGQELAAKLSAWRRGEPVSELWTSGSESHSSASDSALGRLALGYVQGELPPLEAMVREGDHRRVHLPTYPFARTPYWAPEPHPMLSRRTGPNRFTSLLTGTEVFLADHELDGCKVLPGVAYLEMAREAAVQGAGASAEAPLTLRQVVWIQPLVVDRPLEVSLTLQPQPRGGWRFSIESERGPHAQGLLEIDQPSARGAEPADLEMLKAEHQSGRRNGEQCYEPFRKMGFSHGPAHQGIREVFLGPNSALAELSLPAVSGQSFILHPGILDSALQVSAALQPGTDTDWTASPLLPFELSSLELHRPCQDRMWALVRRAEGGRLDYDLWDSRGNLCLRLRGFLSRRLDLSSRPLKAAPTGPSHACLPQVKAEAPLPLILAPVRRRREVNGAPALPVAEHRVLLVGMSPAELRLQQATVAQLLPDEVESRTLEDRFERAALGLLEELRGILAAKPAGPVLLQVAVIAREEQEEVLAGLAGMLKTARLECSTLRAQLIVVSSSDMLAERLLENARRPADTVIAYGPAGERTVEVWEELTAIPASDARPPWKDGGCYLITGANGRLASVFAREIATHTSRTTLILSGRAEQARAEDLAFLADKAQVIYLRADLSRPSQVQELFDELARRQLSLNGILHAAGLLRDSYIPRKTAEELRQVLGPKVAGLVALDRASQGHPLDWMILFSAGAGAFGNAGQADYAAANAFMDCFAAYRNKLWASGRRRGRTLAVDWPLWRDGGMTVDPQTQEWLHRRSGMTAMSTDAGVRALYQAMAGPGSQVFVVAGEPEKLRAHYLGAGETDPAAPAPGEADGEEVSTLLSGLLRAAAGVLSLPVAELEADEEWSGFGFDSISLTALANRLNEEYDLELTPTIFFERSTPRTLAETLAKRRPKTATEQVSAWDGTRNAPVAALQQMQTSAAELRPRALTSNHDEVAVIGLSVRFPGAADLDELWRLLREGRSAINEVPPSRWDWRALASEDAGHLRWGSFIDGVETFDPLFFGLSGREAEAMDPAHRLLLKHAWNAIEHAGYNPRDLKGSRTGVFVGVGPTGYEDRLASSGLPIEGHTAVATLATMAANRISYFLDLRGPSQPIETACSSSLVAVHRALSALRDGTCTLALVGGANLLLSPRLHISTQRSGMLAPDGLCKAFAAEADGYVRGEGVGMLLLKPLSRALADNDTIHGVIKGSAENHGGRASSFTSPNPLAQADLLREAYAGCQVDPATVGYLEAHGTGTKLGDPIEVQALKAAFEGSPGPCALGSIKSNLGHLEVAAGLAGLVKALLCLRERTLVPTLHCENVNPLLELSEGPFQLARRIEPFPPSRDRQGRPAPRRAGVSSFGAGGSNAHVVLQEPPPRPEPAPVTRGRAMVVLSARTAEDLQARIGDLRQALEEGRLADVSLAELAYTLQVGRQPMQHRAAVLASSLEHLGEQLALLETGQEGKGLFRGQCQRGNPFLEAFRDSELSTAVESWLREGRDEKLLELWVQGLPVRWEVAYGSNRPRRVALPTYPFSGEPFMLPPVPARPVAEQLHPLLHRNASTLSGLRYETVLHGDETFLLDHLVQGQKVLPGSAYLEMARAAASLAWDAEPGDGWCLREVFFLRPLVVLEKPRRLSIELSASEQGLRFGICSEVEGEVEEHCRGMAEPLKGEKHPRLGPCREGSWHCDHQQLYSHTESQGLRYGPSHRGIESVWAQRESDGRMAASAVLGFAGDPAELVRFQLHPGQLDSILQTSLGLELAAGGPEPELALPFALERAELYSATTAHMTVNLRQGDRGIDFEALDDQGRLALRLSGFQARPRPSASGPSARALTEAWSRAAAVPESSPPLPRPRRLLLVSDPAFAAEVWGGEGGPSSHLSWAELDADFALLWPLDGVMLVWPQRPESDALALRATWRLLRRLLEEGDRARPLRLWGVTTSALRVGQESATRPRSAALFGLLGSLAEECPAWSVTLVDRCEESAAGLPELLQLPPGKHGRPWAFRQGMLYSRELLELKWDEPFPSPYRQQGVYLVLGGAGGLGGLWSEHVARQTRSQLIWVGRRPLDEAIEARLGAFREAAPLAPAPLYLSLDARDPKALARALRDVKERFGALHGVVVSTLVLRDRPLHSMSEEDLLAAYSAKAGVAEAVESALGDTPLDFLLFFSSLMAYTPQRGQANYAAGCCVEGALAQCLEARWPGRVKLVNWGYWGTLGAVASAEKREAMARRGVGSIEPAEAMQAVDQLLASPLRQMALSRDRRWDKEAGPEILRVKAWRASAAALTPSGPSAEKVLQAAARVLDVRAEELDLEQSLEELGFDAVSFERLGRELASGERAHQGWVPSLLCRSPRLGDLALTLSAAHQPSADGHQPPPHDPLESELESALSLQLRARLAACQEPTSSYLGRWWQEVRRRLGKSAPLSPEEATAVEQDWKERRTRWLATPHHKARLQLVEATLNALPEILRGAVPATEVVFAGSSLRAVQAVYQQHPVSDFFHQVLAAQAVRELLQRRPEVGSPGLRVLEVGAGTGATSAVLLAALDAHPGLLDEYLYSDLSAAFLRHAEETHAPGRPYLRTRRLNVEEPLPLEPVYDMVIAANVLHATSDVALALRHLKAVLRPGGVLLLNEISEHSLYGLLTFGLLEGWWRFSDEPLRMVGGPGLSPAGWQKVLEREGFQQVGFPAQAAHDLGQQIVCALSDGARRLSVRAPLPVQAKAFRSNSPERALISPSNLHGKSLKDSRMSGLQWVTEQVAEALKLAPESLDPREPLQSYGLDSILVVGLSLSLSKHLPVSTSDIFEHATLESLANHLLSHPPGALRALLEMSAEPPSQAQPGLDQPESRQEPWAKNLDKPRPGSQEEPSPKGREEHPREPIAIIGVAARFAGADNLEELWQHLVAGRSTVGEVPPERWDWRATFHPERGVPGRSYSRWGGFLKDIDAFDPLFFRIAPSEAERMDPNARLFLETAYACLEDAGIPPALLSKQGPAGVFVGVMNADYPGASLSVVANRISYHFDLRGPSLAVDTACSSSLTALHMAVESLRRGDCRSALAGGVNLMVHPKHLHRLCELSMLSAGERNRAFAAEADGFVPGEGVAAVLLKPLSQALADGDQVHGLILGSAINAGGRTSGFTVPGAGAQAEVIASAWRDAGISPRSISYLEAHGTGTVLGDPLEVEGLRRAFSLFTDDRAFCALGSVKSNLGHCEGAAGMAGLCKVLMQMRHGRLVPTLHAENLNPRIDFQATPLVVQRENRDWVRPTLGELRVPRRAGLSSFGAGGANAHVVLEEYPEWRPEPLQPRAEQPLLLSARDQLALRRRAQSLAETLRARPFQLADVVTTLAVGREAMNFRLAILASSLEEACRALDDYLGGRPGAYLEGQARRQQRSYVTPSGANARALAESWVEGAEISWTEHLSDRGRRISLPTYPFARERFWLPRQPQPAAGPTPTASPRGRQFYHSLDSDQPFFTDHRPGGRATLPAATSLELARQAAEAVLEGPVVLENLVWPCAVSPAGRTVSLRVTVRPGDAGSVDLELAFEREGQWRACLLGGARLQENLAPVRHEVASLRPWEDRLEAEQCYPELASAGLEYGPAHRSLVWVSPRPDVVVAELQGQAGPAEGLAARSALIDGAMQAAHWLRATAGGLPFALSRVECHGPLPERVLAVARQAGEGKLDVDMCDGEGLVLLRLQGLSERRATAGRDLLELCRGVASGRLTPQQAERWLEDTP